MQKSPFNITSHHKNSGPRIRYLIDKFLNPTSMEKVKSRLEILLIYVTLIVSLSAFKEELSKIYLSLSYSEITASQYLLYCVYGFSLCLYLYILEFILSDTRIGK
jgi:hypothetical protein